MCAPVLADGQGFNNLKNTCKTSTFQAASLRLKRRILLAIFTNIFSNIFTTVTVLQTILKVTKNIKCLTC